MRSDMSEIAVAYTRKYKEAPTLIYHEVPDLRDAHPGGFSNSSTLIQSAV